MSDSAKRLTAASTSAPAHAARAVLPLAAPNGPPPHTCDAPEEVDVWWGAYSGWTMLPALVVCLVLTGLIALAAWAWVPRGYRQLAFVGLAGALWLLQGIRFAYRVFGINYRLTSRRLFRDRGFLHPEMLHAHLCDVAQVIVRRSSLEKLVGVARIQVHFADTARPPLILEGVCHAEAVANLIREWKQIAQEAKAGASS